MKNTVDMAANNQKGVTLVELLVVLAIIGILVGVGVSMVGGILAKHRLNTSVDELSTRLRAAVMLSVVHNKAVTVVFANTPGTDSEDSYFACIDNDKDGSCADEAASDFINLDSGRTGAFIFSQKKLDKRVDMYDVIFSSATPLAVTFLPPSGLVNTITSGGAFVNGIVCFESEVGDAGDADQFAYRRVTVDPIVGRTAIWRNTAGFGKPDCRRNPEDNLGWERVD